MFRRQDMVTVTVDSRLSDGVSRLQLGVTHTQFSLDTGGDTEAIARGKRLLGDICTYHNVHIMGWGTMNPNPSPNTYDWESLDRRMAMVRSIRNAIPVITLCAAPDWMKGGTAGKTDWSKIETAPVPEHYADFARLAATVARRYPEVRHFQVWNEFKGLWDSPNNNWHYRNYTNLYNLVYDELKKVNTGNQVGGPYLVIEGTGTGRGDWSTEKPIRARQWEVLDYWLANKRGADFFVIDRGIKDFHDKNTYTEAEDRSRTPLFGEIVRQIRARTNLPIWYAEFYAGRSKDTTPEARAAIYASTLLHMTQSGAAACLLWQPMDSGEVGHALISDTRQPGGGQPYPLYTVYQHFRKHFAPGTKLMRTTSSSTDVEALASFQKTLLVNKRDTPTEVQVNGKSLVLKPLEVRLV